MKNILVGAALVMGSVGMTACSTVPTAPQYVAPTSLASPTPIDGNEGAYMSPYTSDDVIAEWVDNALKAKSGAAVGGAVGSAVGQYAASQALNNFGFLGSMLGKQVGKKMGRDQALKAAGGEEVIKETSDLSFNKWEDLAVFMYVNHSQREEYADVLAATQVIYPELESYASALARAPRRAQ